MKHVGFFLNKNLCIKSANPSHLFLQNWMKIEISISYGFNKKGSKPKYDISNQTNVTPGEMKNVFVKTEKQWVLIFNIPFTITTGTELQWLQCRINHYVLTTKYKIGNMDTNRCTFCEDAEEKIYHLLW